MNRSAANPGLKKHRPPRIDAAESSESPPPKPRSSSAARGDASASAAERPVLLLFHDPGIGEGLARDLSVIGYSAQALGSTERAIQRAAKTTPAAVIVEDRATGMNPFPFVQTLRELVGEQVPVILISNTRLGKSAIEALHDQLGRSDVIVKPYSLQGLSQRLKTFVEPAGHPEVHQSQSLTNYTNVDEVFYAALGRAMRAATPTVVSRERSEGATSLYIRGKSLLSVTSSDATDSDLGQILIQEGIVTASEVAEARRELGAGEGPRRLGAILIARTSLSKEDLARCLERQAEARLAGLFGWRTGTAQIQSGALPPPWAPAVRIELPPRVLAGLRMGADRNMLAELIDRLRTSRIDLSGSALATVRPMADGNAEAVFLDQLAADKTVTAAMHRSGIDPEAAGTWLVYLSYIAGATAKSRAAGVARDSSSSVRLRASQGPSKVEGRSESRRSADEEHRTTIDREFSLGWKMMSSGHYEQAVEKFAKVVALDASRAAAKIHLGWCKYRLLKDPRDPRVAEATGVIFSGLTQDPNLGLAYVYLARIHADLGEQDQAAGSYLKAIEVDPGNGEALAELRQLHVSRARAQAESPPPNAKPSGKAGQGKRDPSAGVEARSVSSISQARSRAGSIGEAEASKRSKPESAAPAIAPRHALVVVDWSQDHQGPSISAHLSTTAKARLVNEVRAAGGSLEEFSFTRLCAVVGPAQMSDNPRLRAALLGVRLLECLKDAAIERNEGPSTAAARVAIVPIAPPLSDGDHSLGISEALGGSKKLLQAAAPWQVLAAASLYRGFENLVDARTIAKNPEVIELRACSEAIQTMIGPPSGLGVAQAAAPGGFGARGAIADGRGASPAEGVGLDAGAPFSSTRTIGPVHMLRSGAVLRNYRIDHLVGTGGMGEVYQATDMVLGRLVAIKVMRRDILSNPLALRRFQREAQALARINSVNVTQIYDLSIDTDPAFLAMEFVDGASLRELLQDRATFSVPDVVDVAIQTVAGLAAVYAKGLIHRDVNPKNLLLDRSGTLKITDFGMVKMDLAGGAASTTNAIVGTPLYMSPEQAQGTEVDFRTDLYSLALTLFHLLAGRPPFSGDTVGELLTKQILEPLPAIEPFCPRIPPALAELLRTLAAKHPADRPATHEDVSETLNQIRDGLERS